MPSIAPDHLAALPSGRRIAYDDRGDPDGVPVLYLHGTPDTRLARHPDDRLLIEAGIRLIAADRPGLGSSDPDPNATPFSVADDHAALCAVLGLESVHVVAWSAGAIFAIALAGGHPDRVATMSLVAPLVPADAYGAPGVLDGAGDSRQMFAELAPTMDPEEAGRELAMWLVPPEIDEPTAREILGQSLVTAGGIDGAAAALVAALVETTAQGMIGLEREIAAQATPLDPLFDMVRCPVTLHAAGRDTTCPPAMAEWYARRLADREPTVIHHADGDHMIGITAWADVIAAIN